MAPRKNAKSAAEKPVGKKPRAKREVAKAVRTKTKAKPAPAITAAPAAPPRGRGLNVVRRETLKEQIYREVRHALRVGKFEPGESITVKLLEEELGAGTMPVRESLQRLVAEGALINLPNGRARVPLFTADEFDELKEIRLRLEGLATHQAAIQRTDEELAHILECYEALNEATAAPDRWADVIERNYAFHFAIYEAAHTSHLLAIIDSLWLRVSPLLSIPARMPTKARSDYAGMHEQNQAALVEALKAGDGRAAEAAIREIILMSAVWYHRHHKFATESIPVARSR